MPPPSSSFPKPVQVGNPSIVAEESKPHQVLRASARRILIFLMAVAGGLTVASGVVNFMFYGLDFRTWTGQLLLAYFDLNSEHNIPTAFAALLLLLAGLLLFVIGWHPREQSRGMRRYWLGLGWVFVFVAADEALMFHERIGGFVETMLGGQPGGIFHRAWVIPYAVAVIAGGVIFWRFVLRLPPKIRNLFILSAVVFVGGALGLEFVEGAIDARLGARNAISLFLYNIQEAMEMAGVITFIYALVRYLALLTQPGELRIAWQP